MCDVGWWMEYQQCCPPVEQGVGAVDALQADQPGLVQHALHPQLGAAARLHQPQPRPQHTVNHSIQPTHNQDLEASSPGAAGPAEASPLPRLQAELQLHRPLAGVLQPQDERGGPA